MSLDATPLLRLYANTRLHRLATEDSVEIQRRQLLDLVRKAAQTRFGRDHDFASIRSVEDYQARVPLRTYAEFWREYWETDYPILDDVTWPGRIPYFAFTSGTSSGSSKFIPVSRDMVSANRRAALEVLVHHMANCPASRVLGGKSFILGGSTDLVELAEGVYRGDLSGIAANEMPFWAKPYSFPPKELALEADWERKIHALARVAPGLDIRVISGTPSWVLLFLERVAEISGRGPELARLWPQLEMLIHGGVGFGPYRQRFDRLLSGAKAETREVYPASEGFIAIADRHPGEGLRLLAENGLFVEFVPLAELASAKPTRHWIANARTGVDYALVLTTCAGLFSYVLGDTVRLVDTDPPRLLVTGRTTYMINLFGEHLSGEQIEDAVVDAAARAGQTVADYSFGARFPESGARGHHILVAEFTQSPGPEAQAIFNAAFDETLRANSLDYAERRAGEFGLGAPYIMAVPSGFFVDWMKRRGRMGGQNKVPRVVTDEELLDDLVGAAALTLPPAAGDCWPPSDKRPPKRSS